METWSYSWIGRKLSFPDFYGKSLLLYFRMFILIYEPSLLEYSWVMHFISVRLALRWNVCLGDFSLLLRQDRKVSLLKACNPLKSLLALTCFLILDCLLKLRVLSCEVHLVILLFDCRSFSWKSKKNLAISRRVYPWPLISQQQSKIWLFQNLWSCLSRVKRTFEANYCSDTKSLLYSFLQQSSFIQTQGSKKASKAIILGLTSKGPNLSKRRAKEVNTLARFLSILLPLMVFISSKLTSFFSTFSVNTTF